MKKQLNMSKIFILVLFFFLFVSESTAQQFVQTDLGGKATVDSIQIEIQFFSKNIIRVIKYPEGQNPESNSFSVIKKPEKTSFKIKRKNNSVSLKSSAVMVTLDFKTGKINFRTAKGIQLLAEKDYGVNFLTAKYPSGETYRIRQDFVLDHNEKLYGLGQIQNGKLVQCNENIRLNQENKKIAIPFFQSNKGYGLFWDNNSPVNFSNKAEKTSFESEAGDAANYYFMAGGNADGVIALMRDLTGQVPMIPYWSFGFFQSRERYTSQDELVDVVKKYRDLGVPLDGIVQDWQYWGTDHKYWNGLEFGNPLFPDPERMMNEVHQLNAHIIISVWPSFGPKTKPFKELNSKNMMFDFTTFPQNNGVKVYDVFNPKARDIVWKYMNDGIFKYGMDGWWLDATEPDLPEFKESNYNFKTSAGFYRNVCNAFPLLAVGGVYENQRKVSDKKRVFILTRSAFAGQQRYGATSWSGDVNSSWEVLHNQIPAGLSFSLCGLPYWNSDIGGFFAAPYYPKGVKSVAYRELYVRWLQFGTFCTLMRSHGTHTPREIYQFGKRGDWEFDAIEKYIKLRYRLLPYIYSNSWEVTSKASTMMRALMMDFGNDEKALTIEDQFLFGKEMMVCPVTEAQYTANVSDTKADFSAIKTRKVYLPAGTSWYDFWTGDKIDGGQEIVKETPVDIIPLYIKAGAILPLGPEIQYSSQQSDLVEIRVYPGANGKFVLYDDEKDGYNYEKGIYSTIEFAWNDKKGKLTIGKRQGSYPGMLAKRTFKIVIVANGRGVSDKVSEQVNTVVVYDGKELVLKLSCFDIG